MSQALINLLAGGKALVTLSGSIPTLKAYEDSAVGAGYNLYLYGENKQGLYGTNFQPYDVSLLKTKCVYYKNNTDSSRTISIYGFISTNVILNDAISKAAFVSILKSVAAGAEILIMPHSLDATDGLKELDVPIVGIFVASEGTSVGAGTETVRIFGRVS